MLCLPKENADAFKRALKNGDLQIQDLMKISSEDARAAFAKVVGEEYAEAVNTMFESKLILKDQQAGLIDFIKTAGGLKPEARYDLVARVQRRQKAFTPAETEKFLSDYADATLGTTVTREEASKIFELTKKVEAAKGYQGVTDLESLVASFEKLDPKNLDVKQQAAVKDLRTKLEAEKAAKVKEAADRQTEKQKIAERIKEERERIRGEKEAERKRIREEKKVEREKVRAKAQEEREQARLDREAKREEIRDKKMDKALEEQIARDVEKRDKEIAAKEFKDQEAIRKSEEAEEARLERDIAKENERLARQEARDQDRFEQEQDRMAKSESKQALERATGESLKTLRKTFERITNQKFKGIEQFSDQMKAQLEDLTAKREAMAEGDDRLVYGRAKVELENYVATLTHKTQFEQFKEAPVRYIAGTAKSLKATLDNSVLGRQGLKTLLTNPTIWGPNAVKTFVDIWNTIGGKAVMDEIRADIVSRPNYDLYKEMKLAVNVREEQHPTSLIENVPYLGRLATASENAFAGFMLRMRADLADVYIDQLRNNGVELTKERLESWGKLINSQTSRGSLGRAEPAADIANVAFFSLRKLKADIDTLTLHAFDKGFTKDARRQAAINLLKIIGGISLILAISKALDKDSVDFDPRSADFGKIKIGNTRFDVSGGMSSLVTLASRVAPVFWGGQPKSKSSVTGEIKPINSSEFGAQSASDVLGDFMANKESPILALFHHIFNQKGQDGKPLNVGTEFGGLFMPLPISNAQELAKDPDAAPFVLGVIADSLGVGTNTYAPSTKQTHDKQLEDLVKQNYEAKQSGGQTKSAREIAKEIYGSGFDDSQENAVQKEMDFYRAFGSENKLANEIHDARQASDVIDILDKAHGEMPAADFRRFYTKAQDSGLISTQMNTKWEAYLESGINPDSDTNLDGSKADRKTIEIITTFGKAIGASPMEAFKLLLQNQSIRRIDNGTIVINRNTNFFDKQVGKTGYSEDVRKERDASKDQRLDHVIPVEGGGLEKGNDADNLQLISEADWKRNSQVENYLGKALRESRVEGKQLREYIIRYKAGQGEPLSPELQKEFQKEYAGVPLTFAEIKQLVK